jgi:hypothetical protein
MAIQLVNGGTPARFIKFVGVRFIAQTGAAGLVRIGGNPITSPSADVEDVVFDRCIVENPGWLTNIGFLLGSRGDRVDVINSYLQGAMKYNGEVQAITFLWGNHRILNNYIADVTGENVMFGGTAPSLATPKNKATNSGEFAYNSVVNHERRLRFRAWIPNEWYFKNAVVRNAGTDYITSSTCFDGATFGSGCTWTSTTSDQVVKNNFECKNCADLMVHHNTFDGMWVSAQYESVVFKVANCPKDSGTGCQCPPGFSGNVNVNGLDVTSADGNPLPFMFQSATSAITINGVAMTIADFDLTNQNHLLLASSGGTLTNVPYSWGNANCIGAYMQNLTFENNIVVRSPQAWQIVQLNESERQKVGNILARNNLFYEVDCDRWRRVDASCGNAKFGAVRITGMPPGVIFKNNTVFFNRSPHQAGVDVSGTFSCVGIPTGQGSCTTGSAAQGDTRFLNNIVSKGSTYMVFGESPPANDTSSLSTKFCQGGCNAASFNGNILTGVALSGWPTTTYNLCSSSASCTPDYTFVDPTRGKLFEDYNGGFWKVASGWNRAGAYAEHPGARWDSLPSILHPDTNAIGPKVTATSNSFTLTYNLTAPQRYIRCSVEAATSPDLDSGLVNSLDAAQFLQPGHDTPGGLARSITVTGLTSGTTYYFRLHCGGGFYEGSVTTP